MTTIEEVIKITGAEEVEHTSLSGVHMKGYKVAGKLATYFISMNHNKQEHLPVYNLDSKRYISIWDKGTATREEKIISRLLALKNDEFTVKHISTLR